MNIAALAYHPSMIEQQQEFQVRLNHFNSNRLMPTYIYRSWQATLRTEYEMRVEEGSFIESERQLIQRAAHEAPEQPRRQQAKPVSMTW